MSESKDKDLYNPAFPVAYTDLEGRTFQCSGLDKFEYAAIHLRTPIKNTLDEMIEASRRDEFTKVAMEGLLVHLRNYEPLGSSPPSFKVISKMSLDYADALLAASNKRKEGD